VLIAAEWITDMTLMTTRPGIRAQWQQIFENKIQKELLLDTNSLAHYKLEYAPLIYSCLMHHRIKRAKRQVQTSATLESTIERHTENWNKFKLAVEAGDDLTGFMSKRTSDWIANDTLLNQCGIYHFHLRKGPKGGEGRELILALVDADNFYALCLDDHLAIYDRHKLVELAEKSWPDKFFRLKSAEEKDASVDRATFKKFAHHPETTGINYLAPARLLDVRGNEKALDNPQHSAMTSFDMEGVKLTLPLRALCDYLTELDSIEGHELLLANHKIPPPVEMIPEPSQRAYIVSRRESGNNGWKPVSRLLYQEDGIINCPLAFKYF
jgi:hypothetical protein